MADSDELILWSLERSDNIMGLNKWYYMLADSGYAVEITHLNVKFSSKSIIKKSDKIQIDPDTISCISFYFRKDKILKSDSIQFTKLIGFKSDMIKFSANAFKYWNSIENKEEKGVYIFDRKIQISPDYEIGFFYFSIAERFDIEIINKPLSMTNIENVMNEMKELENIYFISIKAEDPSTALVFLNSCKEFSFLKSIELEIKEKWNLLQYYRIKEVIITLTKQGKRVKIYKSSKVASSYLSF